MNQGLLRACTDHLVPIQRALEIENDEAGLSRVLETWSRVPAWVTEGYMPELDAVVVHEVVRAARPRTVVEIGTASGVSVCAAALGLQAAGLLDASEIHTYDCSEFCYFDNSRLTGEAVAEMLPELAPRVHIHRGKTTLDASRTHAPASVEVAIIDGDHRHPFPMIDLALLRHVLAPGAWVVLHDIYLPRLRYPDPTGGPDLHYPHTGAEKLFEAWPWDKAEPAPGAYVNIGVIRMPEEPLTTEELVSILRPEPYDDGVSLRDAEAWLSLAGLDQATTEP